MKRILAAIALLLPACAAAQSVTPVSSPSDLAACLAAAQPGDVCDAGATALPQTRFAQQFADYVTIRGGYFDGIEVDGAAYLRFEGSATGNTTTTSGACTYLQIENGSHHIAFVGGDIAGCGYAVRTTNDVAFITFEDNDIHHAKLGGYFNNDDLTIRGNRLQHIGEDGFRFQGCDRCLIENNRAIGWILLRDADAHSDFMQFGGGGSDITVRGNIVTPSDDPASSEWHQGIFFRTSKGEFVGVRVENNMLVTGNAHCIYIEPAVDAIVRENTCLDPTTASGTAVIAIHGSGTSERNITVGGRGGVDGTNHVLQVTDSGAPFHYDDYFTGPIGRGMTIEALRPVPGSPSVGAHALIAALLDGAPVTSHGAPVTSPEPEPRPEPAPDK